MSCLHDFEDCWQPFLANSRNVQDASEDISRYRSLQIWQRANSRMCLVHLHSLLFRSWARNRAPASSVTPSCWKTASMNGATLRHISATVFVSSQRHSLLEFGRAATASDVSIGCGPRKKTRTSAQHGAKIFVQSKAGCRSA